MRAVDVDDSYLLDVLYNRFIQLFPGAAELVVAIPSAPLEVFYKMLEHELNEISVLVLILEKVNFLQDEFRSIKHSRRLLLV